MLFMSVCAGRVQERSFAGSARILHPILQKKNPTFSEEIHKCLAKLQTLKHFVVMFELQTGFTNYNFYLYLAHVEEIDSLCVEF